MKPDTKEKIRKLSANIAIEALKILIGALVSVLFGNWFGRN